MTVWASKKGQVDSVMSTTALTGRNKTYSYDPIGNRSTVTHPV